jgi:hypothetical protein
MKRVELVGLLDTMASLDRQRITARMPVIRIEDLEELAASDDPTEMSWSEPTSITVRFRTPTAKSPALSAPARVVSVAGGDMTLIGAICALSLSLCAALAWLA